LRSGHLRLARSKEKSKTRDGGGDQSPTLEENHLDPSRSIGELRYYGLEIGSGREISKAFQVISSDEGELTLDSAVVLPSGVSTGAFNLRGIEGSVIDLVKLTDANLQELSPLERLNGSGSDQVEYKIDSEAVMSEGAERALFQFTDKTGQHQFIEADFHVAPQDIAINVISPTNAANRDSSKDLFTEKGTLFYLHDLILQNNQPLKIEVQFPTALSSSYLIRRYEDIEVPNQDARAVDSKKCGAAVSKSRRYPENRTKKVGLLVAPKMVVERGELSQYLASGNQVYSLVPGEALALEVFALGRSDLDIAKQIFASRKTQKRTVMSGCKSKKDYYEPPGCDNGRVYSGASKLSSLTNDKSIQCGRYRYYGVPQYSQWPFENGISKVFLDLSDQRNSALKVRPAGGYADTFLNNTPLTLSQQKILYSNGVE
jgi:hypothetical protein